MYGTIVAQRRSHGTTWLVISGISGPATYAAATLVKRITATVPSAHGGNPAVLYAVVEARIKTGKSTGDSREVVSCRFLHPPKIWPPQAEGR